jgi:NMD protein affecting ribosome stability and mRNA decay
MQARGEYYSRKIYSEAITDTNEKTTVTAEIQGLSKKSLVVKNGLEQNVSLQIQGSADKITFVNVGTAQTVNASSNAIIGENEVAQLKNYFPFLKATITAAIAPTSGTIEVHAVASL